MNAFEKGYQAWKASKAAPAAQATKNSFELSNFDQKYLQWQYNTGRITEEQAVAQLNKPYTDFIGQVNNVLSGYDQFAKNYTARFGSRKNDLTDAWVGDSQQYLADTQAYQANLISQTDAILKTLEANPDAFDKDTVDQIKSALHTVRINVENITKAAEQDNAYWSSWGTDEESKLDKIMGALKSQYDFMPGNEDSYLTGEAAYARAQQDQSYAKKYEGVSGVKLLDVINSVDDQAEKEWVTGQALRTMAFDEAQEYLQTMKQEYLELSQTGTLRNHAAAGMNMSEEEKAAAEAAVAQYEAVMKKYGIDTSDEDINPMEALSNRIQTIQTMIAESERVQEHIRLSNVRENKDFEAYAKKGEAEAMEYAEKNKKTAHMNNKEIDVLAYYIAKDKENGTNLAEQYKESLMFYLKHRRAEEIADWVNDLPGVVKALTLPRITYAATAKTMNWGQDVLQNFSKRKLNQTVFQMADDYIGQDLSGAARIAHQAAGVVGYMAPSILASKFIGGATGVGSLGKAAGSALMFLGSSGQAYGYALEKGYDQPQARAYATLVGLSEVGLQNALGGISEFGGLPAKLAGKIAGIKNALLKSAAKFGASITGEIIEEELQNVLEPAFRSIIFGEKYDMPTLQEAIDTAIVTALSTGGMEGPGIVKESIKDAKVYKLIGENITEHSFLTPRERVVVNTITDKLVAEAEQGGKKLSADEKQKIYDQVVDDMDTGRIDIQQIEEAIGKGDQYKQLVSEFEELKELNKLDPTEMTGEQSARLAELEAKNQENNYEKAIKSYDKAFSQAVEGLVKSDRLAESYRERDRRREAYKVEDLSQYSEAQQQTIRDAMNSGILNNTRRTHEFVDFIAKVSDKLGVKFNFTDNKRLRESGFAMEGVTVNGFVNKDGITVNVNSAKALNSVVGHEVTHVLKGTKLFDKLQKVLFNYAKTKGEYDSRLQQITDLYKDKKGYTDNPAKIKEELMADLVGDYLFTDKQFVEKLFTEERGLFNWIRKQINYLHSLATAGSKEARQLERAKKVFDDVFQNKTQENEYTADNAVQENAKTETDYSLSNDSKFMEKAISKAQKNGNVSDIVLQEAKEVRSHVAERLNKIKDEGKVGLPEDVQGNTFFGNSSYGGSEENTTVCPRSLAAEALVDAVSETLGRPLTVEEQIYISQDIQGRSLTPECTYCYVATDRKAYREFLGEYVKQRDSVISAYKNGNHDTSREGSLYQEFLDGRKDTDNMWKRFSMWIDTYKSGAPMLEASHLASMSKLMGDIQSEFGKELKPQITDAMAYAQSASWAKKRVSYVAYNGHILNWKQSKVDALNSHYGLRMYSFSDFSPAFILENMQMITDAAVKGLKVLGYTKELDFAKIFAPTGMNINISTFGFEKDGGVYENNIIGANWAEAQKLRAENPNVGITFVATNDKLVEWALDQDWIDVVIPYHLVRTGKALAQKLGFTDYTKESADVKDEGWTDANEKSISPTMHNNDKATYLAALKENHLKPRFERFINHPNYMKLVNECRQSASESQPVQPKFNQAAADESLAKLEANGYYQPIGGTVDRMYEIASEIADKIEGGNLFSLSYDKQKESANDWNVRGRDVTLPAKVKKKGQTQTEITPAPAEDVLFSVSAPVKKVTSGKQRKWVKTSTESEAVDRKILPEDLDQELIHYQPISNQKTLDTANSKLGALGYDAAVQYMNQQIYTDKVSLSDIALGERLIQEAVKRGDTKTAGDLIMDISILGTELGQKVQALSIIKRLTPEGQLKALTRVVSRGHLKGDKSFDGVEITQEMKDHILGAYNKDGSYDQKDLTQRVEDVKDQLAEQMQRTVGDYTRAWRYLAMLGNPKTHIRNLVSNAAMAVTRAQKNVLARTMEDLFVTENRTKTWKRATDDVKAFAQEAMNEYVAEKGKYNEGDDIKSRKDIFFTKGANWAAKKNSDLLAWEDNLFSKSVYRSTLQEYLTANGIKTKADIAKNGKLVAKAKAYAEAQAKEATFQQDSYIAKKISEIENRNAFNKVLFGAVMPFKTTPINIAKTAVQYSPLSFARSIYDFVQVGRGKMNASDAIDRLSKGITGTSLSLIGFALASMGVLNGAGEDDKEGQYDYQLGKQTYSVNIGGNTYSLNWLSPTAMPLFVGVNFYEQLVDDKEWNADVIFEALAQTLDPMSEMSFLSSLDDVLKSYESGAAKFMGIFQSAGKSYISQFFPTILSQLASTFDSKKRVTKASPDSGFKFGEGLWNQIKYKLPGLRNTLEPATDIWGNELTQSENFLGRALESFFAPYSRKENLTSDVDEELKDLYDEVGDNALLPNIPYGYFDYKGEKYKMSDEEYTQFKETYGQTAYDTLEQLMETRAYKNASADEKADMVKKVYDYAKDVARQEYLDGIGEEYTNATKNGRDYYKENPIAGAVANDMTPDEYSYSTNYPGKYAVSQAVGGYEKYQSYTSHINKISADKDANGKTVENSRKQKVVKYINNLDASYGEKIILYVSEYPTKENREKYGKDIVEYLNGRKDISRDEMIRILEELGFTVKNGKVSY